MLKNKELDYQRIERYINDLISQGKLKQGDRLIPETQIAGMFKVSRRPVRSALQRLIDQGILQKVKGQGTFVRIARTDEKLTNRLGVVYFHSKEGFFHSSFYTAILAGIESAARDSKKLMVMQSLSPEEGDDPDRTLNDLAEDTDGLVLLDPLPGILAGMDSVLSGLPKPVVVLNYEDTPDTVDSVVFDSQENVRRMFRFLHGLGHRRIAFMMPAPTFGKNHPNHLRRCETYRQMQQELGLDTDAGLYIEMRQKDGDARLRDMITGPTVPTAVFCSGDDLAIRAYGVAYEAGVRIPDQLTVVGYDDIRECPRMQPGLTTVHTPLVQMGSTGVRRLIQKMEELKRGEDNRHRIVLPGSIAQRGSHKKLVP